VKHEEKLEGGCFCGAVRYRLLAPPMFVELLPLHPLPKSNRQRLCHQCGHSKLPWVKLPKGAPAFIIFYDLKNLVEKESQEKARG